MQQKNKVTNLLANSDQNISNNQVIDLSQQKYKIKEIDQSNENYYASQISKNEKYLAYGGDDLLLEIYDLEFDKLIKEIKQEYAITVCQFTCDSSLLFVGSYQSVYEYDVFKDFKLNKRLYLYQDYVINMVIIQNRFLITSSYDKKIIKTDTKYKKQLYKLQGHTDYINALEYNEINDIIISGSHDNLIKLLSGKDKGILISKDHGTMIQQIQLLNNRRSLLSLDNYGKIREWKIDLIHRDLKQYNDLGVVYNFYQVNQGQNILIICNGCIKILNNQGQTINLINYQVGSTENLTIFIHSCFQNHAIQILSNQIALISSKLDNQIKSNQLLRRSEIFFYNLNQQYNQILNHINQLIASSWMVDILYFQISLRKYQFCIIKKINIHILFEQQSCVFGIHCLGCMNQQIQLQEFEISESMVTITKKINVYKSVDTIHEQSAHCIVQISDLLFSYKTFHNPNFQLYFYQFIFLAVNRLGNSKKIIDITRDGIIFRQSKIFFTYIYFPSSVHHIILG